MGSATSSIFMPLMNRCVLLRSGAHRPWRWFTHFPTCSPRTNVCPTTKPAHPISARHAASIRRGREVHDGQSPCRELVYRRSQGIDLLSHYFFDQGDLASAAILTDDKARRDRLARTKTLIRQQQQTALHCRAGSGHWHADHSANHCRYLLGILPSINKNKTRSKGEHRLGSRRWPVFRRKESISFDDVEAASWGGRGKTDSATKWSRRSIAFFAAIGVAVIALGNYLIMKTLDVSSPVADHDQMPVEKEIADVVVEAENLLRRFLATETIERRLELVRHPDNTEQRIRAHVKRGNKLLRGTPEFSGKAKEASVKGLDLLWLRYHLPGNSIRTAVFEKTTRPDTLKLDWESLVNYQEAAWSTFIEGQDLPNQKSFVFRVIVREDEYLNYRYHDSRRFACYRIEEANHTGSCWAYAEIGSDAGTTLARSFQPSIGRGGSSGAIKVVLRIRFVPHSDGKAHSQALIEDVVSESWFVP